MIRIDDRQYFPALSPQSVDHLLGNKSSRISCEITFTVLEYFKATTTKRLRLGSEEYPTGEYIVSLDNKPVFQGFKVGDLFDISGTPSGTNDATGVEIIEKISDNVIRTTKTFPVQTSDACVIEMVTPISGIRYSFGIIENNESTNFNSKITGQEQQLVIEDYDTLVLEDLDWIGATEVQIGSAKIQRLSAGTRTNDQQFKITHIIDVNPVTLPSRYADALNGIAPPSSRDANSLKHVFKIEGAKDLTNPNLIHEVTDSQTLGNVGWKDERFNGGETNYSVTNIQYFRDALNEEIPSLEIVTTDQRIEITIENTVDSPFSDTNTEFVTNYSYSPEVAVEFTNNGKTPLENFYIDRAVQTVGDALVNGENFGTPQQIIKEVISTFISTSVIEIEVIIGMSSEFVADISSRTTRKSFEFNVEIQNHALSTSLADLVTLPIALEQFYDDVSDPTLAIITPLFFRAYEGLDVDAGESNINLRSEDNVKTKFLIQTDRTGRTSDVITIRNAVVEQVVRNDVEGIENVLESYNFDASANGLDQTDETFVDFSNEREFQFPNGNEARIRSFKRRQDLDSGNLKAYEFRYPFLFRWDDFTALRGLDDTFFDPTKLNNGKNNDWYRLSTFADWNYHIRLTVNYIKNGNQVAITEEIQLDTFTYLEDADWINETTKYFDGVTDITPALLGYKDTGIELTKEFDGAGTLPLASEVHWIVRVEVWLQGSIIGINYLASWEDFTENSWFKSIDASNMVVKSRTGDVHKAELLLDYQKIIAQNFSEGTKLKISGRIYDTINTGLIPADAKLLENGLPKLTEDGLIKLVD